MKTEIQEVLTHYKSELLIYAPKVLIAAFVLVLFIVVGNLLHRVLKSRIQNRWKDAMVTNFIADGTKWGMYILGIVSALNLLSLGGIAGGLIAAGGVGAIIFGFAFKDIGENFLSGLLLALNRPFELGDIIEVEGFKGTVKELSLRTTHIRNIEGKDMFLPNSTIIKNTLTNYTRDGFLRMSFGTGE